MNIKHPMRAAATLAMAAVVAYGGAASAQETLTGPVDAPKKSAEIGLGLGFSQPSGNLTAVGSDKIADYARGGAEVNAEVGYRIDARWLLGGYGAYSQYHAPGGKTGDIMNSANFGVQAQLHLMPFTRTDPWIGLGVGYRGFFATPDDRGTRAWHGIQLARLRVGADYRVNETVAMGPVLGMDLNMFTAVHRPGMGSAEAVGAGNLAVTPFFFAGIAGRFDLGGERERETTVALHR